MGLQTFESYAPGTCGTCKGRINRGDICTWGAKRGERIHLECASRRPEVPPMSGGSQVQRTWSSYQTALFNESAGSQSLLIEAVAGSGKTTSLEEFCRRIPVTRAVGYFVFNKKNAVEAEERMPGHVQVATLNAAGWRAYKAHQPAARIEGNKMRKIFRDMVAEGIVTEREADDFGQAVAKLVGLAKNEGVGAILPDDPREWGRIVDHYDVTFDYDTTQYGDDFDAELRGVEIARQMLARSNEDLTTLDFDDQMYLTVKLHVGLPRYDVVCVDESQDTNRIQRAMLKSMLKPGGRLVAVGDPRQAIYGFRGASSDAMDLIRREFNCTTMKLSVNYRCSLKVIEAAKEFCPDLLPCDTAPEGSVVSADNWKMRDWAQTDVVLCRVNAPLVTLAYKLLGEGIPCTVLGRDIGQGLITLIQKMVGKRGHLTVAELEDKLDAYRNREVTRWTGKGEEAKAQSIEDKVASVFAAIDAMDPANRTVDALIERINSLFSDDGTERLTLSTVHKAKGLEWDRVFILDRNRMPSKWARQGWQIEQENNLIYVAYTRAKKDLFLVKSDRID